jgi:membrane protease YdiL (CAAX protease family)
LRSPSPTRAALFFSTVLLLLVASSILGRIRLASPLISQLGIFLGASLYFAREVDRRPASEVFRLRPLALSGWIRSLCLGVVAWALIQLLGALSIGLVEHMGGRIPPLYPEMDGLPFAVALLIWGVLPAICEELAFRGYIQWNLGPLGDGKAIWMTGLLFGAMHMSLIRLIPLTVLGLLFATAVQRSGSILPGMFMHFLNNGIVLALNFFGSPAEGVNARLGSGGMATVTGAILLLGPLAFGLARSFGPGDVAGASLAGASPEPTTAEGSSGAGAPGGRLRAGSLLLALLPALLLYALAAANELYVIFRSR